MKSFRKQYIDCKRSGNVFELDIAKHLNLISEIEDVKKMKLNKVLVCVRYKTQCSSKVCKGERGG